MFQHLNSFGKTTLLMTDHNIKLSNAASPKKPLNGGFILSVIKWQNNEPLQIHYWLSPVLIVKTFKQEYNKLKPFLFRYHLYVIFNTLHGSFKEILKNPGFLQFARWYFSITEIKNWGRSSAYWLIQFPIKIDDLISANFPLCEFFCLL